MRMNLFRQAKLSLCLFLLTAMLAGCSLVKQPVETSPYENLLIVLADYGRGAQEDLYRHEAPIDLSGQNLFRATIERLDYYERANPGKDAAAVSYARAECYARLGDYGKAVDSMQRVADSDSTLSAKAREEKQIWAGFIGILTQPVQSDQLGPYFDSLERRQKSLDELATRLGDNYNAVLARVEREKADVEYALALFRNRYVVEDGSKKALDFMNEMIQRHEKSRRIYAHHLMLGQFYYELARDQVELTPPDRTGFDLALFLRIVDAGQKQFVLVSQADGYPEKPEAMALAEAIGAFARQVRNEAR